MYGRTSTVPVPVVRYEYTYSCNTYQLLDKLAGADLPPWLESYGDEDDECEVVPDIETCVVDSEPVPDA